MPGSALFAVACALTTVSAAGRSSCIDALRARAAQDLRCDAAAVSLWSDGGVRGEHVEAYGCGFRAGYVLDNQQPHEDAGLVCTWNVEVAPRIDPDQAKNELRLNLGAGAPTGIAGVSYERRVGIFAVEPGFGWGVSGFQASLLLRVRNMPILGSPGVGVSLAFGPQASWLIGSKRNVIVWLNAEPVALEHRFESGPAVGVGAGIVVSIAGEFSVCRPTCTAVASQSLVYPALRVGLGWWL
jgi:hypothetical protein